MNEHKIVSNEQWISARRELLEKEKEFTKLRDELTALRQSLPWEEIEQDYCFDGPTGPVTLSELFGNCSQLIIYHFMYGPDWPEPCKICTMLADHYDPIVIHLRHRDVSLATVSRAPIGNIEAYKQRMDWSFPWVSSLRNDFNWDFNVSFTQQQLDAGAAVYNYRNEAAFAQTEAPGISAFAKNSDGQLFHTYSSFGRGLEDLLGIYRFLDIVSTGRNETGLPFPMDWVLPKDRYDDAVG